MRKRLLLPLALVALAGCGQDAIPPSVDVTGTWVGPVDSTTGPPGYTPVLGTYTMTLVLAQSGANVSGSMTSDSMYQGTVAGAVAGDRMQVQVTVDPCGGLGNPVGQLNLSGIVTVYGSVATMQIDYVTPQACGVKDHDQGTGALKRQ